MPAIAFYVLSALAEHGEGHGFTIVRAVRRQTEGALRLGPGTLYRTINYLLGRRWIEVAGDRSDPELDDAPRRYYRLTVPGRRRLDAEHLRRQEASAKRHFPLAWQAAAALPDPCALTARVENA